MMVIGGTTAILWEAWNFHDKAPVRNEVNSLVWCCEHTVGFVKKFTVENDRLKPLQYESDKDWKPPSIRIFKTNFDVVCLEDWRHGWWAAIGDHDGNIVCIASAKLRRC